MKSNAGRMCRDIQYHLHAVSELGILNHLMIFNGPVVWSWVRTEGIDL